MNERARVVLLTGNGKGKTCAALGLALRAAGHEMRVLVLQFLKHDASTGEIAAMGHVPQVDIVQAGLGYVPSPDSPQYSSHLDAAGEALNKVREAVASGEYSMVILDEVCGAITCGLIDESDVLEMLRGAPAGICLVLTGRGATRGLIEAADTVTDLQHVKHPYESGAAAQKGVEL